MTLPTFDLETVYWKNDIDILGVDEVGRGAFAGPLVLGGVVFPKNSNFLDDAVLSQINDSKLLSPVKRQELAKRIYNSAIHTQIIVIPVRTINKYGIGKSTQLGVKRLCEMSMKKLNIHLFMDGFHISGLDALNIQQSPIVKGDRISTSIAAASIIAKVYRDDLMENLHKKFEEYNFLENKGYGTKFHRDMLRKYGLSKIHRTSFSLEKFCLQQST